MAQQINVVSTCTLPAFEPLCSNCNIRPIAEATNCFEDWCHECDTSLWVSRQSEYVDGPVCSNCNILPVAAVTNCFKDWCHQCDASLWASRSSADKTDLNSSTARVIHPLTRSHPILSTLHRPTHLPLLFKINIPSLHCQALKHSALLSMMSTTVFHSVSQWTTIV